MKANVSFCIPSQASVRITTLNLSEARMTVHASDLVEECYRRGWTDGLPVVPPTPERVEQMLGADAASRDEVVAVLPPSGGVATLEVVAANAVMAGCLPSYLPVVRAAVDAVAQPEFNLDRVMTTASTQSPVMVVSGPVVRELGISGGWEALGSRSRANATIGRAVMLTLQNVAGHAGAVQHSTLSHPGRYTFCFAENDVLSPWPTWTTDRGFDPGRSWVSVFPGEAPLCITDMGREDPELVLRTLCESLSIPGTYTAYFRQDLWLVLSPQHADVFARAGWSRADLAARLHEGLALPADRLVGRGLYGYLDEMRPPTWLETDGDVRLTETAERIVILVAGGDFGGYTSCLFGQGTTVTRPVLSSSDDRTQTP
jgi:hypothetical protein